MKYFSKLGKKDFLSLLGLVVIGFTWIMIDQIFFKNAGQRFIAFVFVMLLLFFTQYWICKPVKIWAYTNSLTAILLSTTVLSTIIIHVFIKHDFEQVFVHSLLIWLITGLLPYLIGFIYSKLKKSA